MKPAVEGLCKEMGLRFGDVQGNAGRIRIVLGDDSGKSSQQPTPTYNCADHADYERDSTGNGSYHRPQTPSQQSQVEGLLLTNSPPIPNVIPLMSYSMTPAMPIERLGRESATVDCPTCGLRAWTRTSHSSGFFTHVMALVSCYCVMIPIPYFMGR